MNNSKYIFNKYDNLSKICRTYPFKNSYSYIINI